MVRGCPTRAAANALADKPTRSARATVDVAYAVIHEELGELKETVDRDDLVLLTIFGLLMASWFLASVYWILEFEPQRTEIYAALGFDTTRRATSAEYEDSFRKAVPLFLIFGLVPVFIGLGASFVGFAALSGWYSRRRGVDGSKVRQAVFDAIGNKRWIRWLRFLMSRAFDLSARGKKVL